MTKHSPETVRIQIAVAGNSLQGAAHDADAAGMHDFAAMLRQMTAQCVGMLGFLGPTQVPSVDVDPVAAEREACALEVEEQIAAIERMKQGHPFRGYDAQEHLRYAVKRIRARGKR